MTLSNRQIKNDILYLPAGDYVSVMEKYGLFSDAAANMEHDPRVWREFLTLCHDWTGIEMETEISLHMGKYAFCKSPVDPDRGGQNFAMVIFMVDPCLPVTWEEFAADSAALAQSLQQSGEKILTDSFMTLNGYGRPGAPNMAWIESPVAEFKPDMATYIESLSAERRKKYRRMERDFADTDVTFTLSQNILTESELTFARDHLTRKWGDEEGRWALLQTLWSVACARVRPDHAFFMRASSGGQLAFVQTLLSRQQSIYCQSIFKNEDMFFDGIAPFTDIKCIEALTGIPHRFFDPSCRTSLDDPPSIGVAKRVSVNYNLCKPVFIAGGDIPPDAAPMVTSGQPVGRPA